METISKFIDWVTYPFRKFQAHIAYDLAVNKANDEYARTGKRQFVVKAGSGRQRRLIIMNRENFRLLKRKGLIKPNKRIIDVQLGCIYATPDRAGREPMLPYQVEHRKRKAIRYLMRQDAKPQPATSAYKPATHSATVPGSSAASSSVK